jgi:hypothetical protein
MQLLVVHHDAEIGEQLVQMVKDYTSHECDLSDSSITAVDWGQRHGKCALLLTQLVAEGIDGLTLGATLSEMFSGLQIVFFPPYPASEQQFEVPETKVFPEPIDGDALLGAIERAENALARQQDSFQIVDLIQMCCLGNRGGALQIVKGKECGFVFLSNGQLLHAETTNAGGMAALAEIVGWDDVEFAYDGSVQAPVESISLPWGKAVLEALSLDKERSILTSMHH